MFSPPFSRRGEGARLRRAWTFLDPETRCVSWLRSGSKGGVAITWSFGHGKMFGILTGGPALIFHIGFMVTSVHVTCALLTRLVVKRRSFWL